MASRPNIWTQTPPLGENAAWRAEAALEPIRQGAAILRRILRCRRRRRALAPRPRQRLYERRLSKRNNLLGIEPSPAFVRQPEASGCVGRAAEGDRTSVLSGTTLLPSMFAAMLAGVLPDRYVSSIRERRSAGDHDTPTPGLVIVPFAGKLGVQVFAHEHCTGHRILCKLSGEDEID
jgi:hypothetical protein